MVKFRNPYEFAKIVEIDEPISVLVDGVPQFYDDIYNAGVNIPDPYPKPPRDIHHLMWGIKFHVPVLIDSLIHQVYEYARDLTEEELGDEEVMHGGC